MENFYRGIMRTVRVKVLGIVLLLQYTLAANINNEWKSAFGSFTSDDEKIDNWNSSGILEKNFLVPVIPLHASKNENWHSDTFLCESSRFRNVTFVKSETKSLEKKFANLNLSPKSKNSPEKVRNIDRSPIRKSPRINKNSLNIFRVPLSDKPYTARSSCSSETLSIMELSHIMASREEFTEEKDPGAKLVEKMRERIDLKFLNEKINQLRLSYSPGRVSIRDNRS